jgi:hypothetical protein
MLSLDLASARLHRLAAKLPDLPPDAQAPELLPDELQPPQTQPSPGAS